MSSAWQPPGEGKLDEKTSEWDERASLGVVMAAGGYPAITAPVM
ncbi:hypothetical protein ACLK2A_21875 [Escherichia coli]